VIGLRGFQRVSGPEFDTYVRSIRDLNEKIPRTAKWQRFEPTGIAGKLFIKPPTPG
jgi:hypothetical protein